MLYDVRLILPGERDLPLQVSARVVRSEPVAGLESQPPLFASAFVYESVSAAVRARIARFVFGVQREEQLHD
jgi:hypothetical protein